MYWEIYHGNTNSTKNNYLEDKYSKYAPENQKIENRSVCSFPNFHKKSPPPLKQKLFLFLMIDLDTIPLRGSVMIHWVVANILGNLAKIPENVSQDNQTHINYGNNIRAYDLKKFSNNSTLFQTQSF